MVYIQVSCEGMPQDIDDAKKLTCYGPYLSRAKAAAALRKRGWIRWSDDVWRPRPLFPPRGERTCATIHEFKAPKIKSPRSFR